MAHESGTHTASCGAGCCFICALSTDLSPGDDWQNFMGLRNFKQLIYGCKICLLNKFHLFSCAICYLSNLFIPFNLCAYLIRHSCINKYKGNGTLHFLLGILFTKIIVQFDVKNFPCFSWISSVVWHKVPRLYCYLFPVNISAVWMLCAFYVKPVAHVLKIMYIRPGAPRQN